MSTHEQSPLDKLIEAVQNAVREYDKTRDHQHSSGWPDNAVLADIERVGGLFEEEHKKLLRERRVAERFECKLVVDGVALEDGDCVLMTNQSDPALNGVHIIRLVKP